MRRLRWLSGMAATVGLILGGALPQVSAGPGREDADAARGKVFVGYVPGPPRDLDYRLYTHLCQAFLVPNADGTLRERRGVPSRELTAEAHRAGVKVLISLGGWGPDREFAAIVANPEAEDRFVAGVLKIVGEADYDGIDLDWEYPDTAAEIPGFERLTRRFRKGLDEIGAAKGRGMLLTMAVSANPGTLRWLDRDLLVETMDWLNVMTYDMAGPWLPYAGHNSPLFGSSKAPGGRRHSVEAAMMYLVKERGMPPDRLAVGIPLYGRGFAVKEPYALTEGAPKARMPEGNYANLLRLLDEGWTRRWDDETKTPWLIAPDGSAVIGYDDAESVSLKADWAMKQGFRGVFFWQVHGDRLPDGSHPLQEAARREWGEGR